MIHDPKKLCLTVEADETIAHADVSVSLGLIVTKLVINAIKHAFPNYRDAPPRLASAPASFGL